MTSTKKERELLEDCINRYNATIALLEKEIERAERLLEGLG